MNNSIKFNGTSSCGARREDCAWQPGQLSQGIKDCFRCGRGVRLMLLLAAMVGAQSVWTEYLFY